MPLYYFTYSLTSSRTTLNIMFAPLCLAITHSFSLHHLSYSLPLYSSEISALLSSALHLGSTQFLHAPAFTSHFTILSRSIVHVSTGDCCFWRTVLFAWLMLTLVSFFFLRTSSSLPCDLPVLLLLLLKIQISFSMVYLTSLLCLKPGWSHTFLIVS